MHSPCYSLAIALTGEGLRSSNNEGGSEGTSAFSPRPVGRGGEGRAAPLTLEPLLSLADNDGYSNNSRGGVGGDYLGLSLRSEGSRTAATYQGQPSTMQRMSLSLTQTLHFQGDSRSGNVIGNDDNCQRGQGRGCPQI